MSMPAIEIEIQSLLNDLGDAGLVADELLRRWERNIYNPQQQFTLAQFLLHCGFYASLFQQIERLLLEERYLPWAQFAEALGRSRILPSSIELKAIAEGLQAQDALDEILLSRQVDRWDPLFLQRREERRVCIQLEYAAKKISLHERLDYVRSQRMLEEERRILEQLNAIFPGDQEVQKAEAEYQERWARDVVARNTNVMTDVSEEMAIRLTELTPETKSIKELFVKQALRAVESAPQFAYDLALLLAFMDFFMDAVAVLEFAPSESRVDWLRLELLLKGRQYLAALDETSRLEVEYAGDPESTFTVVYARARALWGLGQSDMAIDLVRSIVKIRPNYKSAQSLLADWLGGDF